MSKKKLIIIISSITAAIVAAVAIVLAIVLSNESGENTDLNYLDSARTIKIVELEGNATVTDEKETINCFKGKNLYNGDTVDVLENSVLVIKFDEDKYVYIGENSKINLKSQGKNSYKTNIFVEKGVVLAEIQKPVGEDEEFFLSSNNSVMAVRGTIFGVTVKEVGNEYVQTYSVYKGVTELYVFDKLGDELIQGKLTDISNSKIELTVPKDKVLEQETFDDLLGNWLDNKVEQFDNSEAANEKLEEVEITVGKPSKEDYQDVMDKIGDSSVSYSAIEYNVEGYFGAYDGEAHSITLKTETQGAIVQYKDDENGIYKDEMPKFTLPGSYRVYFKISCEGYSDKEDYSVVQITKADLLVEYDNIPSQGLVAGMSVNNALGRFNLFDYVVIKGVDKDANEILKATFTSEDTLLEGTNSYKVNVVLPDTMKNCYNDLVLDITLNAATITLYQTDLINNHYVDLDNATKFNKFSGVAESELFANPVFYVGDQLMSGYNSYEFSYPYKTDGYYELKNGINEVNVLFSYEDYDIQAKVTFNLYDYRDEESIVIEEDGFSVVKLAEDVYYFNTNDMPTSNNKYQISSVYLLEHLGLNDFPGYINLSTDVLDNNSANYQMDNSYVLEFNIDDTSLVELVLFPNNESKGAIKYLSIYFSKDAPSGYPEFEFINSFAFLPNSNIDFIISDLPVKYSFDDNTYQENISISELGEYNIYYRVGDTVVAKGIKTITITNGFITIDPNVQNLISGTRILSNDNDLTVMYYDNTLGGGDGGDEAISSTDNSTISSFDDIYEIYTGIIKNSKYYNSVTNEELDVEVFVSEKKANSADFSYEVVSSGYISLQETVSFEFTNVAEFGQKNQQYIGVIEYINGSIYVINPQDKTVSLSEIDEVYASRVAYSLEDIDTYEAEFEISYSIDGGKTWSKDVPVLTEVGEYDVYQIYQIPYLNDDVEVGPKTIVKIQHITITE
jgi:hypothetical protein